MRAVDITRFSHYNQEALNDIIAEEEALNIDIIYGPAYNRTTHRLATTMRTPGADHELAVGLVYSLGIIEHAREIGRLLPCQRGSLEDDTQATLSISLIEDIKFSPLDFSFGHPRYSGCGICGSAQINGELTQQHETNFQVTASLLSSLPQKMLAAQTIFALTGGVHAAALFDEPGNLMACFEDVGRHNALDKLIGSFLIKDDVPLSRNILLLSSRASFEIIQKASRAQIPVVAVVGAVSSLAVQVAHESNITLVGFLRNARCNVYTHARRVRA